MYKKIGFTLFKLENMPKFSWILPSNCYNIT